MALVPHLSSSLESGDKASEQSVVETSLRITTVFSIPAALGVAALSRPILELLFHGQTQAIEVSAPLLSVLSIAIPFSCLITTTNAVLQSNKRIFVPVLSMAVGVAVKLVVSYFLIGDPRVGTVGAPIGSLLCSVTVTAINIWVMSARQGQRISIKKVFIKPLISAIPSVALAVAVFAWMNSAVDISALALMCAIITAVLSYAFASVLTGNVTNDDIELLPFKRGSYFIKNKKDGKEKYDDRRKEEDAS
jgi:stage V sporulation protein B